MARKDEDATAFNGRHAGYTFNITASTESADGFDEEPAWVRGLWSALEPHHTDSVYVNFLMEEGEDRVRAAYGGERYDRLKALKAKYDPENLFSLNQNIPPGCACRLESSATRGERARLPLRDHGDEPIPRVEARYCAGDVAGEPRDRPGHLSSAQRG